MPNVTGCGSLAAKSNRDFLQQSKRCIFLQKNQPIAARCNRLLTAKPACCQNQPQPENPMQSLSLADELSAIRIELARLQLREASLCAALQQAAQSPALPVSRPGWPIRRETALH